MGELLWRQNQNENYYFCSVQTSRAFLYVNDVDFRLIIEIIVATDNRDSVWRTNMCVCRGVVYLWRSRSAISSRPTTTDGTCTSLRRIVVISMYVLPIVHDACDTSYIHRHKEILLWWLLQRHVCMFLGICITSGCRSLAVIPKYNCICARNPHMVLTRAPIRTIVYAVPSHAVATLACQGVYATAAVERDAVSMRSHSTTPRTCMQSISRGICGHDVPPTDFFKNQSVHHDRPFQTTKMSADMEFEDSLLLSDEEKHTETANGFPNDSKGKGQSTPPRTFAANRGIQG